MSKTILYDGDKKINKISIICMFKNNESYLSNFFFKIVAEFEETYEADFEYYIIENNSSDNTRVLLKDFFKKK
jgi:hypothetical protein